MFFYDPTFVLLIPALLLALYAQQKVAGTFSRYVREHAFANITGAQVARAILDAHGLYDVPVELTPGHLTDHYDPRKRVLRLSRTVYQSTSIAALGVAAHEVGHALQHAYNYWPLNIRNNLFPVASFGSQLAFPLFFMGLIFGTDSLMLLGIWFFIAALLFQVVTLPVEFNASSRALQLLRQGQFVASHEVPKVKAVLNAAALTYVAAVAMSLSQLVRLLVLRGSRRD